LVAMQSSHRLCAYDRAGLGASEPPPKASRTTSDLVDDLRALLDAASIPGPFVLGSWSIGAWPATLFTQRYPDEVVGLVFVDPRGPRVSESWRAALPPAASDEPRAVADEREALDSFETDPSLNDVHLLLTTSAAEAAAALDAPGRLFGDRPVVVLSAANMLTRWRDLPSDMGPAFEEAWRAGQKEFADESTTGTLTIVPDSGHGIQIEQPPVVIEAIESILADAAMQ